MATFGLASNIIQNNVSVEVTRTSVGENTLFTTPAGEYRKIREIIVGVDGASVNAQFNFSLQKRTVWNVLVTGTINEEIASGLKASLSPANCTLNSSLLNNSGLPISQSRFNIVSVVAVTDSIHSIDIPNDDFNYNWTLPPNKSLVFNLSTYINMTGIRIVVRYDRIKLI